MAIAFINFITEFFSTKISHIQTDGGTDFKPLKSFLQNSGINHRLTCPYSHQLNGSIETRHRRIVDTGLTLLKHASLPLPYWDYTFEAATYLINRLPTPVLKNLSPFQKLFNQDPDYSFLRVFGCLCFPNLRPYNKHKLSFQSTPTIFLGYAPHHKGYICYDWKDRRTYISRDVIFHETDFPFASSSNQVQSTNPPPTTNSSSFATRWPILSKRPTSSKQPNSSQPNTISRVLSWSLL